MPTFDTQTLLDDLANKVENTIVQVRNIETIDKRLLTTPPADRKWSIAQIIEHLNSYNRYYLPQIEKAISNAAGGTTYNAVFKSGFFGNYFTNMMLPKNGNKVTNKMNAPKDHVPVMALDTGTVIAEFIAGQTRLLEYLAKSSDIHIGKLRVPISISRYIKLKLGDTFRFLIAHQVRHFVQLKDTFAQVSAGMHLTAQPV